MKPAPPSNETRMGRFPLTAVTDFGALHGFSVEPFEEIMEGLAIGQDWDGDTRIVLFVIMRGGHALTDELRDQIRARIRANCTPRHVPAKIVAVADIPRTKSGKITELAVRDVVHGRGVKNIEALANPDALKNFEGLAELRE